MENNKETRSNNEGSLSISMKNFNGLYEVRDATPDDYNFIYKTFLNGIYYGDTWLSEIPKPIFMKYYRALAEVLIKSPKATVKVACLPDEPNVILGYSILSSDFQTIHFVYVKEVWRKKGIGRSLVPQYPTAVTHLTSMGRLLLPKLEAAVFNPFKLY
jgi:hypothetical protein